MRPVMTMKRTYTGPSNNMPASHEDVAAGRLHGWGVEYVEFETGPGNSTVAIVEHSDGSVTLIHPSLIRFLDSKDAQAQALNDALAGPLLVG